MNICFGLIPIRGQVPTSVAAMSHNYPDEYFHDSTHLITLPLHHICASQDQLELGMGVPEVQVLHGAGGD
jgi:hypothetical protein